MGRLSRLELEAELPTCSDMRVSRFRESAEIFADSSFAQGRIGSNIIDFLKRSKK